MKPIKKALAITGRYKDRQTGHDKKSYTRCGTLFEREDGSMALKLEAVPVGAQEWSGWLNFYDLDSDRIKKDAGLDSPNAPGREGDDIPF